MFLGRVGYHRATWLAGAQQRPYRYPEERPIVGLEHRPPQRQRRGIALPVWRAVAESLSSGTIVLVSTRKPNRADLDGPAHHVVQRTRQARHAAAPGVHGSSGRRGYRPDIGARDNRARADRNSGVPDILGKGSAENRRPNPGCARGRADHVRLRESEWGSGRSWDRKMIDLIESTTARPSKTRARRGGRADLDRVRPRSKIRGVTVVC